jgi:hypothetical protein
MAPNSPSYYALVLTGILIGAILLYVYKGLRTFTVYQTATFATLLGVLVGVHGILHLGMEWKYNYNPLRNLSS